MAWQARRLGSHASLAIWGGNNEVETSFGWCVQLQVQSAWLSRQDFM